MPKQSRKYFINTTILQLLNEMFIYSYKNQYHRRRIKMSMLLVWIVTAVYYGIVKLYQHLIGHDIYEYNEESNACFFEDMFHSTWVYYTNVALTRFIPLIFNIIVYAMIFDTMFKRHIRTSNLALLRSLLIVVTFTTSWVPGFIANCLNLGHKTSVLQITQFCFYINCLGDPVLYTLTSKVVSRYRSSVLSKRNSIVRMRRSLSERIQRSNPVSIFSSSLVVKNEMSSSDVNIEAMNTKVILKNKLSSESKQSA